MQNIKQEFLDRVAIEVMVALIAKRTPSTTAISMDISKIAYAQAHTMWEVRNKSLGNSRKMRDQIKQAES